MGYLGYLGSLDVLRVSVLGVVIKMFGVDTMYSILFTCVCMQ